MKKNILFAVVIIFAVACSHKSIPLSNAPVGATNTESKVTLESGATTASATTIEAGHALFTAKCGKCHALKDPAHYTAGGWDVIMQKMAKKARLDEEQKAQVTAYLHANAKK